MNRLFVDKIKEGEKSLVLNDPVQVHHLKDVLRIRVSEPVVVCDGSGSEYLGVVSEIEDKNVRLLLRGKKMRGGPGASITVACAIPKNAKMDDIVDKLTQLGVECIIPLETERVIVRLDKEKKAYRLQRWEKIALSSARQSQRARLVKIEPVSSLDDVLSSSSIFDLKIIPTLEGDRKLLKDVAGGKRGRIIVLIGPEGDFTPAEISSAKKAGFLPVSLGDNVLRVDTAAIAVASFIRLNEKN
ncbi:MAG: RsmE family RNA methyltransferase [Candidatus Omnitrophota bacterium]